MQPAFGGFPEEGMKFLRSLKRNNRRDWFQPRKHIYDEQVKRPMIQLVAAVDTAMLRFAPAYVREPEEAIYRIYRDTRFSPDKTPYKTHIAAVFPQRGLAKHGCAGFYFGISPEGVEIAGGVYMPDANELRLIRAYLADHHEEFRAIVGKRGLRALLGEMSGEQLVRVPKGFCADHPAADLVRHKQWLYDVTLNAALATTAKLLPEIVRRFQAMTPFVDFLNRPLTAAGSRRPKQSEVDRWIE